ncbi:hypothetical protein AAFF_G00375610 [Aldrovandia affinis]|uniref:Uncharacterized protein n=1 Tax=Aldrovandia affinis TaxID=143900 RepID=A0AAD7SGD3_9TELE|nr:hypothetical protein AAFF_G00375610 [Aldrovandia affinis]
MHVKHKLSAGDQQTCPTNAARLHCTNVLPAAGPSQLTVTPPFLCGALSHGCHEPPGPASAREPPRAALASPRYSRAHYPREATEAQMENQRTHRVNQLLEVHQTWLPHAAGAKVFGLCSSFEVSS